jgi:hypothetical protein
MPRFFIFRAIAVLRRQPKFLFDLRTGYPDSDMSVSVVQTQIFAVH